jgi:hypothetical protein
MATAKFLSYRLLISLPFVLLQDWCPSLATRDILVHHRPLSLCSVIIIEVSGLDIHGSYNAVHKVS